MFSHLYESIVLHRMFLLYRFFTVLSRDEIKKVQNQFKGSDFVEKTVGVRAVSEPVALLSSTGNGKFLVMKAKYNGITI